MFPFSFKTAANCIPRGSTCHDAFDRSLDPCWVLLPTDFSFFHNIQSWISVAPCPRWSTIWLTHPNPRRVAWSPCIERPSIIWRARLVDCIVVITWKVSSMTGTSPWSFSNYLLSTSCGTDTHWLQFDEQAIAVLRSVHCYAPDRTMADELITLHCLYFGDKSLIYKELVQLYHLPPADCKRKRNGDESDDESDLTDQKKLASKTDDHGTA